MNDFTIIYLLRHGETVFNKEALLQGQLDVPLDENGLAQAACAAKRLQGIAFDAIYSSDLSRAMVTARAIAGDRPVIAAPDLREWALGALQNRTHAELRREYGPEFCRCFGSDDPGFRAPGGESRQEFMERVSRFADAAAKRHSGQRILLVSHAGVLRCFFKHAFGITSALPHLPRIDNTGICIFHYSKDGTYQLIRWNDTAHAAGDFAAGSF